MSFTPIATEKEALRMLDYTSYAAWCATHEIEPRSANGYRTKRSRLGLSNVGMMDGVDWAFTRKAANCTDAPVEQCTDNVSRETLSQPTELICTDIVNVQEEPVVEAVAEAAPVDPIAERRDRLDRQISRRVAEDRLHNEVLMRTLMGNLGDSIAALEPVAPLDIGTFLRGEADADTELILLYSDTHCGQKVEGKEMGGLGGFNTQIWNERNDILREEVLAAQQLFGASRLNIFNLGDLVDGQTVHKGHAYSIDTHLTDQVALAAQRKAIDGAAYAQVFASVHEYGVGGNHGRLGMKGEVPYMANWDRLVYWMAQRFTAGQPNLHWHLPEAWFQVIDRLGLRFVINHGDDIKAWMGLPVYGMSRARQRYSTVLGMAFDYFIIGHHHTPYGDDYIKANGSMVGANEYGLKQLVVSNLPSQRLMVINRRQGLTYEKTVRLAGWDEMRNVEVFAD